MTREANFDRYILLLFLKNSRIGNNGNGTVALKLVSLSALDCNIKIMV